MDDSVIKKSYLYKIELFVSVLIAFFLPLNQKIIVYLITALVAVVVANSIVSGFGKIKFRHLPFAIVLLLYIIGMFYSENISFGLKDIETKLSFALLPIIYGFSRVDYKSNFKYIIWAMVLGCLVSSGICYSNALKCGVLGEIETTNCWKASSFAYYMHPTYLSLYYIVASTFLIIEVFESKRVWWWRIFALVLAVYLLCFVYGFYSFGPWLSLLIMFSVLIFAFFYFIKKTFYFLLVYCGVLILSIWMLSKYEVFKEEYDPVKKELSLYFDDPEVYIEGNKNNIQSTRARIVLWHVASEFISENLLGVGTGDVKDDLISFYESKEMTVFAEHKLNPHNQYLQIGVSIGIQGILALVFAFAFYFYFGFSKRNYYLIALISLFATGCMVESILERQHGVMLLMFFISVLMTGSWNKKLD